MAQRILRGATATLLYDLLDADGEAVNATGTLTVGVTRADGTLVLPAGTPTVKPAGTTGRYTVGLTAAQTATLDVLTATWADSATPTAARSTTHLIVGGFMFSIADLRASEPGLDDTGTFPSPLIIAARNKVEDEAEEICDRSFVPRFSQVTVDGTGEDTIITGVSEIRTVRSIRIYDSPGSATYTSFTAAQLAGVVASPDGQLRRTDGGVFDWGFGNVVVAVEHGLTEPRDDLREAAMIRCVDRIRRKDSQIPERALRYQRDDGFSFELDVPDEFTTGIPAVDAVYQRYSRRRQVGGKDAPVSRTLSLDPQFYGIFRGGRS